LKEEKMNRVKEWEEFSQMVKKHIENYANKQYGDSPNDRASAYTSKVCLDAIEKYAARYGRNARGDEEQERDFLKIAHYACIALFRFREGNK